MKNRKIEIFPSRNFCAFRRRQRANRGCYCGEKSQIMLEGNFRNLQFHEFQKIDNYVFENEKSTEHISMRLAPGGSLGPLGSLWESSSKSGMDIIYLKNLYFQKS